MNLVTNFLLITVLVCSSEYQFVFANTDVRCVTRERKALLKFKEGLTDKHGVMSSWGKENECCKWEGVECSNTTGRVIALQLVGQYLGGEIHSALSELHSLKVLDLSGNSFRANKFPKFICSITQLQHLNLSRSNLFGKLPSQLWNLTNLETLDLSSNYDLSGTLHPQIGNLSNLKTLNLSDSRFSGIISPQIENLANLETLDLSFNYFSGIIPSQIGNLANLLTLDLYGNYDLSGIIPPQIGNLANLETLDLSHSGFSGIIPSQIGNLANLLTLDLSGNSDLFGIIPPQIGNLANLETLDLSSNGFSGTLPSEIGNLTNLETLDLSGNGFSGTLPSEIGNLTNLEILRLSYNQFLGNVPPQLCSLTNLDTLHLHSNHFSGTLPPQIGNLINLEALHLSYNNFSGTLPTQLRQLLKLEELHVSFNSLEGTITEADLSNFTNLKELFLSPNSLTLNIIPGWTPPFQLVDIVLSGCKVGPQFPLWLRTQTNFSYLDLSLNGILGEVPKWLSSLSHQAIYLNLSHNQLIGTLNDFPSLEIEILDVSSNNFSGPIPLFSPSTWYFQMSQNMFSGSFSFICGIPYALEVLDLSDNQLSGKLPNCWGNMTLLSILSLVNNHFSGEIPHSLGSLLNLNVLQLSNNNLSGKLPPTLKNCKLLQFIDIGHNMLNGSIPTWIGEYHETMERLIIRNNRFYGSIPPQICYLSQIQILDLSGNNISGHIPPCFHNFTYFVEKNISDLYTMYNNDGVKEITKYTIVSWKRIEYIYGKNLILLKLIDISRNRLVGNIPRSFSSLKGLQSLNLSGNRLTGTIDPDIGQMSSLEILDLSSNHLSGVIPVSMAKLNFLGLLDFTNNSLSGVIPTGGNLHTFTESAYAGNIGLCGNPLPPCSRDRPDIYSTNDKAPKHVDDDSIMSLSFLKEIGIPIILGFIVGFWGVVGSLIVKESWRMVFYNFCSTVEDWLYVRATIFWAKLRRRN